MVSLSIPPATWAAPRAEVLSLRDRNSVASCRTSKENRGDAEVDSFRVAMSDVTAAVRKVLLTTVFEAVGSRSSDDLAGVRLNMMRQEWCSPKLTS